MYKMHPGPIIQTGSRPSFIVIPCWSNLDKLYFPPRRFVSMTSNMLNLKRRHWRCESYQKLFHRFKGVQMVSWRILKSLYEAKKFIITTLHTAKSVDNFWGWTRVQPRISNSCQSHRMLGFLFFFKSVFCSRRPSDATWNNRYSGTKASSTLLAVLILVLLFTLN